MIAPTERRTHETERDGCTAVPGERCHVVVYRAYRRLLGHAGGRLQARGGDALGLIRDHLPAWLDPAEVAISGINSFWFCYALHDALVKPMPGNPMAPSLAESWTMSDDQ